VNDQCGQAFCRQSQPAFSCDSLPGHFGGLDSQVAGDVAPGSRSRLNGSLQPARSARPLHRGSHCQRCPAGGDRRACEKEQLRVRIHGTPAKAHHWSRDGLVGAAPVARAPSGCQDQDHSAAPPGANVDDGIELGGVTINNLNHAGTDDLAIRKAILIDNV